MSAVTRPLNWFYHEFGIVSIHQTGRNAYLIILARTCRMFAFGINSLILAIFFSALQYTDHQIGLFMTLTLLGDVVLGTFLTIIADRVGRRRVLLGGSLLMICSGIVFALFENFWILLLAAIVGVISVTGGDFGPFRSIEESIISQLTTPSTRADVLSWYVAISTLGISIGSEASGRLIHTLQDRPGWTEVDAYHALFWIYAVVGVVNAIFSLLLTHDCELQESEKAYAQIPQDENHSNGHVLPAGRSGSTETPSAHQNLAQKIKPWLSGSLLHISPTTLSVMYKLWFLLGVDSLADGMVPISLSNYYLDLKFHPRTSTLGDITSASYFLGAISSTFAGPLARKIGLINTMVFTHIPSSASVLLFPFPSYFWMAAGLLLVRSGLNPMDQAPRAAFIAAVVKPEERTAIMGITSMLRNLASMIGPTITGFLAGDDQFWIAFVAAGACRLAYDFGLWAMFVNMKLYENEPKPATTASLPVSRREYDEDEEDLEMQSLADSSDDDAYDKQGQRIDSMESAANSGLQIPGGLERVRSRSPHRSADDIR